MNYLPSVISLPFRNDDNIFGDVTGAGEAKKKIIIINQKRNKSSQYLPSLC